MTTLSLPQDYKETLRSIVNQLQKARYNTYLSANKELLETKIFIGKVVHEKTKSGWGKNIVAKLSEDLSIEFGGVSGLSERSLYRCKLVYEGLEKAGINSPLAVAKTSWTVLSIIFEKIKDIEEIKFYIELTNKQVINKGTIQDLIKANHYKSHKNQQNNLDIVEVDEERRIELLEVFKDEIDLSFIELNKTHSEKELEDAIVANIVKFLGKMGSMMSFVGRQFKVDVVSEEEVEEYFIDLLFYHRKLKSLIAIELKTGKFKPEYSGKLGFYLTALDKKVRLEGENPSIGIIICKSKNRVTVEYALQSTSNPIAVSTYTYNELKEDMKKLLPNESDLEVI